MFGGEDLRWAMRSMIQSQYFWQTHEDDILTFGGTRVETMAAVVGNAGGAESVVAFAEVQLVKRWRQP